MNHVPVLFDEVLKYLDPQSGETVLDCTLGLGGHAKGFLEKIGSTGKLIGIDADAENLETAKKNLSAYSSETEFHHTNFSKLSTIHYPLSIIFADLGVSSIHFDDPSRGFSFREDGPLDMRLDQSTGRTAAELIAQVHEDDLANILFQYGEIRQSRKLAAALKTDRPQTTEQLTATCTHIFGHNTKSMLAQVFQALRIEVNDELGALTSLLQDAPEMLEKGGRLGIIAFHSLEDRFIKQRFKALSTPETDTTTGAPVSDPLYNLVTKKAIKPSEDEIAKNPRARSARLRVLQKN